VPPSVSQLSRQCGLFYISQPYRPPRPVTRIALLYFTLIIKLQLTPCNDYSTGRTIKVLNFITASRPTLGIIQFLVHCIPWTLWPGGRRVYCECGPSTPPVPTHTSTPLCSYMLWWIIKQRGSFIFRLQTSIKL
jgi:hypothetical protein